MLCLQSKTKQNNKKPQPSQPGARPKSEHRLVAETPSTGPKATSILFLSLTLDKLQIRQLHLLFNLAQLVPFSA